MASKDKPTTRSAEKFIEDKKAEFDKLKRTPINMRDINEGASHSFIREKWALIVQSNCPEQVFVFERFVRSNIEGEIANKKLKIGDVEIRIGYFIVGKNGNKNGVWTWGQSCPLIPIQDFENLMNHAKKEGIFGP